MSIKYDELSVTLSVLALALYVGKKLIQPTSFCHPMLLGRQADVAQVRNAGESPIYRNFGVGGGAPLPTRPLSQPCTIVDFIAPEQPVRSLWETEVTNAQLREQVSSVATGFLHVLHLTPKSSKVLLALDDSYEFLLADLALASLSIPSITVAQLNLMSVAVEKHIPSALVVQFSYLDRVLELVSDHSGEAKPIIIVVGDENSVAQARGLRSQISVVRWEELLQTDANTAEVETHSPAPGDVLGIAFESLDENEELEGVQITHLNLTAGVVAFQHIFPMCKTWSPADAIVSSHSLSTPFGRSVAYTAILKGCSFSTLPSTSILTPSPPNFYEVILSGENKKVHPPTVLVISCMQYSLMANAVLNHAKSSWLYSFALRHKLSALLSGELANNTVWDRLVFGPARQRALGERLSESLDRIVITGGNVKLQDITEFRIALSIPTVRAHVEFAGAGPFLASHPMDLQALPANQTTPLGAIAHTGPPVNNVEAKITNTDETEIAAGRNPTGELVVRGPSICQSVPLKTSVASDDWLKTGHLGRVTTGGTFKVGPLSDD